MTLVNDVPDAAVDAIDLSDMAFWAQPPADREQAFAILRSRRPVAYFEEPEVGGRPAGAHLTGRGFYAVARHADVSEISRQPDLFCSGKGALSIIDLPETMLEYFAGMISTDNPRHARLRRIVSKAFSPQQVQVITETIEAVTNRLIDRVADAGGCDFATELAGPLPLEIICGMMGLPPSEHATVLRCSNIISSADDPEYLPAGSDNLTAILEAGRDLTALMSELAAYRLVHPTDDLTTSLINSNVDGEALTRAELASFFILLLTAGNETTRHSLTHALLLLSEHPDQRAIWQADPDGVTSTGVDEVVRCATPVNWMRRTVTRRTVLSGQELSEGDKVVLLYGSANRDEEVFADPYAFDVRRSPNPHLGFGAAGPHFCLGAHLARREIGVMLRQLLTRLPDIEVSGDPAWTVSRSVSGIKHLPCGFTPTTATA